MGAHVAVYGLGYFFLLFLDGDVGPTGGTRAPGEKVEGNTVGSLSRGRAAAARPREASSFLLFFFSGWFWWGRCLDDDERRRPYRQIRVRVDVRMTLLMTPPPPLVQEFN